MLKLILPHMLLLYIRFLLCIYQSTKQNESSPLLPTERPISVAVVSIFHLGNLHAWEVEECLSGRVMHERNPLSGKGE